MRCHFYKTLISLTFIVASTASGPVAWAADGGEVDTAVPAQLHERELVAWEESPDSQTPTVDSSGGSPAGATAATHRLRLEGEILVTYQPDPGGPTVTIRYHVEVLAALPALTPGHLSARPSLQSPGIARLATTLSGSLVSETDIDCALTLSPRQLPVKFLAQIISDTTALVSITSVGALDTRRDSHCTFGAATEAAFRTSGTPEQWLDRALGRLVKQLQHLPVTIGTAPAAVPFQLEPHHTLNDNGVTVTGDGKLMLEPAKITL